MTARPTVETIESLRLTLQKLQQATDTKSDQVAMADLKHILLNRIAELEVTMALAPAEAEDAKASHPTALIPPSVAEANAPERSTATTELERLD